MSGVTNGGIYRASAALSSDSQLGSGVPITRLTPRETLFPSKHELGHKDAARATAARPRELALDQRPAGVPVANLEAYPIAIEPLFPSYTLALKASSNARAFPDDRLATTGVLAYHRLPRIRARGRLHRRQLGLFRDPQRQQSIRARLYRPGGRGAAVGDHSRAVAPKGANEPGGGRSGRSRHTWAPGARGAPSPSQAPGARGARPLPAVCPSGNVRTPCRHGVGCPGVG
jgi:hypothetical protein